MGCGSSSTQVETFTNPKDNKNYTQKKSHERKSSASSKSSTLEDKSKRRRKSSSSSSSSSSVSSRGSRRSREADDKSGPDSARTKKTHTINRPDSDINDNTQVPTGETKHTEDNVDHREETNILTFDNNDDEQVPDEREFDAKKEYEEIQKQTFLTGDPSDEEQKHLRKQDDIEWQEKHEEIAKQKEKKRTNYDFDKRQEDRVKELGLVALVIPKMDDNEDQSKEYTIDDIVQHNAEVATKDWFKFGKKIYSWTKMLPIIQTRIDQYAQKIWCINSANVRGYPVYVARQNGVTRKEMSLLLPVCHVGTCVDIPREQYLSRMKQSAEQVLEQKSESEDFKDYVNQLERWIASYPMNNVYNPQPKEASDPNEQVFPLPADISADPSVLRKWTETWVPFDLEVPENGAWEQLPVVKEDMGDTHAKFAACLRATEESLTPFDMTIEGAVAWTEIELDLVKNDKTTEAQEDVWKKREKRTNLNDPVWMAKRREQLAAALKARYDGMQKLYPVEEYMNFADILEAHWKAFLELCEKEFIPPKRVERKVASENDNDENHVDMLNLDADNAGEDNNNKDDRNSYRDRQASRESGHVDRLDLDAVSERTNEDTVKLEKMDSGLELDGGDDQGPNMNGDVKSTSSSDDDRDSIQLTGRQEGDNGVMRRA